MNVRSFKPGSKVKRAIGLGIAALALTAVNTTGAHAAGSEAETGCRSPQQNLVLIGQVRMYDNNAYSTRIGTVEQWYDPGCYAVFARYQSFNQPFTSNIGVAIYDPDGSYHITFLYNQPAQNYGGPIESPHVWLGHWSSNKWFHARADITNTARGCHMTGDTANHNYSNGGVSGSDWISPGC